MNGSATYSLDPVGNQLSDQSSLGPLGSASATYNADDQPQDESYDASGDTTFTGGNSYAYNSWLRLVSMNGGQVALAYNGLGQLVSKTANGVTTQYLIDDLSPTGYPQVVAEVVNGQPVRTYTYGLERISELQTASNTASFYQYDGRGTVRMLTDVNGNPTDTYEYDAYGNLIAQATVPAGASPTLNSYLYRGERYDADLGLYYLRARWYNPVTGRFLTRDPYQGSAYDPASLHRYNYARANPVNFVDPSGRSAAAENALVLSLNSVAEAAGVAALGYEVRCALYAEASAVHLVDEHMDQDITQLGLLMNQCAAQITVSQFARATAGNLLFMGAVGVAGRGIGWLLESGEQGALLGNGVLGSTDRMGTYTEAGAEVSHSPTVTRIGSDSVSTRVAQNITPIDGVHDVVVHGALYDESGAMFMVEGVPTNASQIADAVTSNPSWNGQPIRLVTCYGGCGPAQELSDILGVDVQGATGPVGVLQSVGSDPVVENGAWITFSPSGVE